VGASRERRRRQGLTLVEVLLVLSLLVVLASVAWPALDRPLDNRRLHHAADVLRTEWARARNQAIATGQMVRFQCTLGERNYSITREEDSSSTTSIAVPQVEPLTESTDSESGPMLPKGITFLSVEVNQEDQEDPLDVALNDDLLSAQSTSETPLFFYPDGSTSTGRVVLQNEHDRCIDVSLRGLTGVATVGDTYPTEGQGL
jgi:prepilin-type N-terminal cleavage/methylation domain-containing protein